MKRVLIALMLCLISIVGFAQNFESCPDTPIIYDNDGNEYSTIAIGTQCWMAEDLKNTTDTNNIHYEPITENLYVHRYNAVPSNSQISQHILLQNNNYFYFSEIADKLCPRGWHISNSSEWSLLLSNFTNWEEIYLDTNKINLTSKTYPYMYLPLRHRNNLTAVFDTSLQSENTEIKYLSSNMSYLDATCNNIIEPIFSSSIIYQSDVPFQYVFSSIRCVRDTPIEYDTITVIDTILVPDTVYIHDTVYITDTVYIHDTVFITADNDTILMGAPEDLPDDNDTEYSMVYPNPTYTGQFDLLYVDYDMPVRLYSPTGVLIKETTRNGYGCCIPFIELADSRYPNGSYIIEYWYQGRRYAEFIIVIK